MNRRSLHIYAALAVFSLICAELPARADSAADFYKGKQISLYVGYPPGGGYDIYARALAQFSQKYIPGNPLIIVKNMEGGNGVTAGGYVSAVTPQDGLPLGLFGDALTLGKVMGGPGEFNPAKFQWVGRMTTTQAVVVVWHTVPIHTIEDVKKRELVIATTVATNSASFIPRALNDLVGTKFKLIAGYQGSAPMALAMERGEVEAVSGVSWEAIQSTKRDWLDEKKVNFLFAFGGHRIKDLPDVPSLPELAPNERARQILTVMGGIADIGRSIAAEPGIPPDRLAALRQGFAATMKDPEYLAFAANHGMTVEPLPGEELQNVVSGTVATPPDIIDAAKKYFAP